MIPKSDNQVASDIAASADRATPSGLQHGSHRRQLERRPAADLSRAGSEDVVVLAAAGRRSQRRIDALQDGPAVNHERRGPEMLRVWTIRIPI